MPFRALKDGRIVTPSQVKDQQPVECPQCGGKLYPRGGKQRARHFFHAADDDAESCSEATKGESDTHARCVALAVAALTDQYSDAASVGAEIRIDASGTPTTPDTRRADALVEFCEENVFFGRGLIIEVQHRHHSKDLQGTTHDYLSAGYSVAWLEPADFDDEQLDYQIVNDAFQENDRRAYSIREHDPQEFDTRVESSLEWEERTRGCFYVNEYGDHEWKRISSYAHPDGYEYDYCHWCEARRRYDQDLTRFVYDYEGVLAPTVDLECLRDAVILAPIDFVEDFNDWKSKGLLDNEWTFERALAKQPEVAPCRGPRGIHEWERKEVLERRYDDRINSGLWICRHCPTHILKHRSPRGMGKIAILFGKAPDPNWGLAGLSRNPRKCDWRPHGSEDNWDYCPKCGQSDP